MSLRAAIVCSSFDKEARSRYHIHHTTLIHIRKKFYTSQRHTLVIFVLFCLFYFLLLESLNKWPLHMSVYIFKFSYLEPWFLFAQVSYTLVRTLPLQFSPKFSLIVSDVSPSHSGQAWSIRRPARRCLPPGAQHHPLHSLLRLHRDPQAGGAVHHLHHPGHHQVLPLWALRCFYPYHVSITLS